MKLNNLNTNAIVASCRASALLMITALVLANGAFAITSSISGSSTGVHSGSSQTILVGESGSCTDMTTLSLDQGVGVSKTLTAAIDDGDGLAEYHETGSPDTFVAAVYAYLTGDGAINYGFNAYTTRGFAVAWERLELMDGIDPYVGGFAYNARGDYAASQLLGGIEGYPLSMSYYNNIFATSSSAMASTQIKNAQGGFSVMNWGERGDVDNEAKSESDVGDQIDPNFGPAMVLPYVQYSQSKITVIPMQMGSMIKSYSGWATSGTSGTYAEQSLAGKYAGDVLANVLAGRGQYDEMTEEAWITSSFINGENIKYSGTSKTTMKGSVTFSDVSSTLDVKAADEVGKISYARRGDYVARTTASTSILPPELGGDPDIRAMMISKDTAQATRNQAKVSESITAKGSHIVRGLDFGTPDYEGILASTPEGYMVTAGTVIGTSDSLDLSCLVGSSSGMASSKGASISGSWTANAAPGDAMVSRQATATDGVNTKVAEDERPGYFRFKESAEARYRYLKAV